MSTLAQLPAELHAFRDRLTGGVLPSARLTRPDDWTRRDTDAFDAAAIVPLLRPLLPLEGRTHARPDAVDAALDQVAMRRDQLITLLSSPDHVLVTVAAAMRSVGHHPRPDRVWSWMCWLTEAAHRRLRDDTGSDAYLLRPLALRLRFLVLSEPLRHREDPVWAAGRLRPAESADPCGNTFGHRTWPLLALRAEEARRDWLATLNTYQSSPLLAGVRSEELDAELVHTVADTPSHGSRFSSTHHTLDKPAVPTVRDDAVLAHILQRHLLPRFRLLHTARLAPATGHDHWRTAVLALATAAVGAAVVGGFAAAYWFHTAAILASLTYFVLVTGAVRRGPLWAAQWLLRFPAASAFGLFALLALPMNWWSDPHPRWGLAAIALVLGAYGYLVIEVRNHGVDGLRALARASGVLLVGAAHAFLLSLVVLVVVAATYTESVPAGPGRIPLPRLWHTTGLAWQVLALATAWSLAVGVFSQILWDDRPITAPLAHLTWNDGG
ncbi:hypothetical protein [Streptomyces cyanogenus]|uniref:Uncharacterized protein n=1 Tax=Streptomyces cyanogenus TaxID=80860 RepID=A0ABX7TTC4_STRCY|nr:hypothetical protein [Streptomyces cyanogenus]QTD99992.1 hypothetical protein S1361_21835 [Streptomyces cyanogenus]